MKIAIPSRNLCFIDAAPAEAAEQRGYEVRVFDVLRCLYEHYSMRPSIHIRARTSWRFRRGDPAHRRIGDLYGTAVLRQFEMMASTRSTNRWRLPARATSCGFASAAGAQGHRPPVTGFAHSPDDVAGHA